MQEGHLVSKHEDMHWDSGTHIKGRHDLRDAFLYPSGCGDRDIGITRACWPIAQFQGS